MTMMTNLWLLANVDAFRAAARHMNRTGNWTGSGSLLLIAAVVGIAVFWAGLCWFDNYRKQRALESRTPQALFSELCRLHRLSRGQRTLLLAAVSQQRPEEMAKIFVDPSIISSLAFSQRPEADGYAQLLSQLFGEGSPT